MNVSRSFTVKMMQIFGWFLIFSCGMLSAQTGKDFKSVQTDSTATDSLDALLEAELARELAGASASAPAGEGQTVQKARGSIARAGTSMNPKISAIGTFLGSATQESAVAKPFDLGLQETEVVFDAYIDPYAKATFRIGMHNERENPFVGPDEAVAFDGEFHTELEEGYLTTLSMPYSLQLKAGKFLGDVGKINQIHPHAWNFVDQPLMYANYFGDEGLIDRGLSLSWLMPNPFDLYQELTFETTSGVVNNPSFTATKDLLYLLHLKNFADLSESTTLELGLTAIRGSNDLRRHKTQIGVLDLTLRWKPLRRNRYKSFEWMSEALISRREMAGQTIRSKAFYSFMRYQLGKRFFLGGRYDYAEFPDDGDVYEKAASAVLSFFATEFQKVDLQYQYGSPVGRENFSRVLLRTVFVIGAHGAHRY